MFVGLLKRYVIEPILFSFTFFFCLQLTNSTLWAPASREGFKELCKKELRQNNTFSESEEGKFMIEHIHSIMCPNECSGQGVCNNGKQLFKNMLIMASFYVNLNINKI